MNTPIRRVATAVVLMVVALLANATYVQVIKADDLRADPRNNRVLLDEYARQRGAITLADGTVVAVSEATDSRLRFLRTYPTDAEAFAPVTGFFSFQYGSGGVERYENSILNGNDDQLFGQRFMDMFSGRDPRGGNVVTTINPQLQRAAYSAMADGCGTGCRGSVVAIEPSTGKILAMVSTPSYDPNSLASHDQETRENSWAAWNADEQKPMLNRAISELYPPGSTFKVVTSAAALRDGFNPDTRLTGAARFSFPGIDYSLPNYGDQTCPGGEEVTLTQALQYSCNTAFADLTVDKMNDGAAALTETARRFGIDEAGPEIPMPTVQSTVGTIENPTQLAQSSIGQYEVRLSPLENAMIAATVANGGVRMKPYLVDMLQSADLRTLHTERPTAINEPITSEQAAALTEMMIASERNTTGGGGPLSIASKTGTAENSATEIADATPLAWYIAFGPSANARIAVAVVVENGEDGVQTVGGTAAAPIGRAVIEAAVGGDN